MKKILLFFIFSFLCLQNIAFAQNADIDKLYLSRLEKKVNANWLVQRDDKNNKNVVANFTINKDGRVTEAKIIKTSGDEKFDKSAFLAIYKAVPYEKLPQEYPNDTLSIQFFFSPEYSSATKINEIVEQKPISQSAAIVSSTRENQEVLKKAVPAEAVQTNKDKKAPAEVDFKPYMKRLQKNIKSNWHPGHSYREDRNSVELFKINKNGEITDVKVFKSSGDTKFDENAIYTIKKSSPVEPLPIDFNGKSVTVQFTFDYKVFGGSPNTKLESSSSNMSAINDYESYKKQLDVVLSQNLPKERLYYHKEMSMNFLIDKSGKIISSEVQKSSGSKNFDNKILVHLQRSSFPPIPDSMNTDNFNITYTVKSKTEFTHDPIGNMLCFLAGFLTHACFIH